MFHLPFSLTHSLSHTQTRTQMQRRLGRLLLRYATCFELCMPATCLLPLLSLFLLRIKPLSLTASPLPLARLLMWAPLCMCLSCPPSLTTRFALFPFVSSRRRRDTPASSSSLADTRDTEKRWEEEITKDLQEFEVVGGSGSEVCDEDLEKDLAAL